MSDYTDEQLRKLDAAVAEARGWTCYAPSGMFVAWLPPGCSVDADPGWRSIAELAPPSFTTSIADAMELPLGGLTLHWDHLTCWAASVWTTTAGDTPDGYAEMDTAPLAITVAWLEANGIDPDEVVK